MSIWKEATNPKRDAIPAAPAPSPAVNPSRAEAPVNQDLPRRAPEREVKESLIAADLTIEGKIDGAGHVRIAGRFKGDINVQGHLTIEQGAKVTGSVRANTVIIAGELEGNIEAASKVELVDSGVLNGDLKAGSLTVAAGSRMRGQVEFGWEDKASQKAPLRMEISSAS
jgi:cytoskeletal protein CcmA (bactofilin family)